MMPQRATSLPKPPAPYPRKARANEAAPRAREGGAAVALRRTKMSDEKPYTGPTITHQAVETVPYQPGRPLTRRWSKWTDGRVTHSDMIYVDMGDGFMGSMDVNVGLDLLMRPPADLRWIDTVAVGL
jgi:hypothetical protein